MGKFVTREAHLFWQNGKTANLFEFVAKIRGNTKKKNVQYLNEDQLYEHAPLGPQSRRRWQFPRQTPRDIECHNSEYITSNEIKNSKNLSTLSKILIVTLVIKTN